MDHALVSGMERKEILKGKSRNRFQLPIKESIHKYGNHPELLFMIIFRAIELLKRTHKVADTETGTTEKPESLRPYGAKK